MIANKEWNSFVQFMHDNIKFVDSNDPVLAQAISLFESEFFVQTDLLPPQEKKEAYDAPGVFIELKENPFSEEFANKFIDKKLQLLRDTKSNHLLSFAASHQDRPLALEILREIESKNPEVLAEARRQKVSIIATSINSGKPLTTKLFKSRQEQNFFEAIREVFPTYHPYPNVAVSCIIDYEAIKRNITPEERDYFFKAIIDSVVFDSINGYEPKFFIELDSHYHDNERTKKMTE